MTNGNHPLSSLPGGAKQTISVNLDTLASATCPSCGDNIFETDLVTYKVLPAIQSPSGQAQLIGIPVISCVGCNDLFLIRGCELIPVAKFQETGPADETA